MDVDSAVRAIDRTRDDLKPGDECPLCERRLPHPKKPASPDTVVFSYRVPVDEADAHRETREVAAKFLATHERPHWQFWTYVFALAAVLQDESLKSAGQRSEVAV